MSEQLGVLMDALEQRAINAWEQLEKARGQVRALEAENRALNSRLDTLATCGDKHPRQDATVMAEPSEVVGDVTSHQPEADEAPSPAAADDSTVPVMSERVAQSETTIAPAVDIPESHYRTPQSLLDEWYKRFPKAFYKGHTQPLQVGIHEVLATYYPVSSRLLRRALACYVNLPRYLKSIRQGVQRVDLSGAPAGEITAEEEQHAREQLTLLQARQQQKKEQANRERMAKKLSALSNFHHND